MFTARALLISFVIALVGNPAAVHAQRPDDVYQQALRKERAEGDLEGAIKLYRQVSSGTDRALAARALVKIGEAYERLGRNGADSAYRRVLSKFSDQQESVRAARARLEALGVHAPEGLQLRKVWEAGEWLSSVSPDGRYVAFQDWGRHRDPVLRGNADIALYDTRERRIRLVTNRPSLALVDVYPTGPFIWSTDGQWLAYGLHAVGWTHRQLHVVRADGSNDRRILDNRQMADLRPMAFSRDNRFVLAMLKGWDNIWRIGTVSLRDSSLAVVKTLRADPPSALSLSPDDRFIAYSYAMNDSSPAQDIMVLAVDGSSEVRVATHPANDVNAFWTSDGGRLVFVSNRSGQRAIWSVRWRDGRADDEPELVYPHLGRMQLRGVSRSGGLYLAGETGGSEAYQATLDVAIDSAFSGVRRLPESYLLTNLRPTWSPDGNRVAWLSRRSVPEEPSHLVVRTLASGAERAFELPFPPGDLRAHRADWSADGRKVRVQGRDVLKRVRGSFEVDVESATVTQEQYLRDFGGYDSGDVTEYQFVDDRQDAALRSYGIRLIGQTDIGLLEPGDLAFRPGETAVVVRNGVYRIPSLPAILAAPNDSARRPLTQPLTDLGHMGSWRLSPDGSRIAAAIASDTVMWSNVLHVVPLTGGRARELDRIERSSSAPSENGYITSVRWSPDGKSVLYAKQRSVPKSGESHLKLAEIWMVDADGGTPRRLNLKLTPYQFATLSFHPDGKRVAFTEWGNTLTEAWILEGLPWQKGVRQ